MDALKDYWNWWQGLGSGDESLLVQVVTFTFVNVVGLVVALIVILGVLLVIKMLWQAFYSGLTGKPLPPDAAARKARMEAKLEVDRQRRREKAPPTP